MRQTLAPLTGQIIVFFVLLIQHSSRDVRHVSPRIAFPGDIDLEVLDTECLLKILEEFDKILGDLFFRGCGDVSNRKTRTNWLFNPAWPINFLCRVFTRAVTYHNIFVRFTQELYQVSDAPAERSTDC